MFEDMFPYNRTIRQVKKFTTCIYTLTHTHTHTHAHAHTDTEKLITLSESANAMGD